MLLDLDQGSQAGRLVLTTLATSDTTLYRSFRIQRIPLFMVGIQFTFFATVDWEPPPSTVLGNEYHN